MIIIILLILNLAVSVSYLSFAIWATDECYTVPCLSSDYNINILRVSVSSSVSAVVYGALMCIGPLFALYLLYTRCRAYAGGVLNGAMMLVTLGAWMQAISWGDQYNRISELSADELLIFGSGYELNSSLHKNAEIMFFLCVAAGVIGSVSTLMLMCTRHEYCVDYHHVRSRSMLRPYQTVALDPPNDGPY